VVSTPVSMGGGACCAVAATERRGWTSPKPHLGKCKIKKNKIIDCEEMGTGSSRNVDRTGENSARIPGPNNLAKKKELVFLLDGNQNFPQFSKSRTDTAAFRVEKERKGENRGRRTP